MPRLLFVGVLLLGAFACTSSHVQPSRIPVDTIRYVPLGDSYTAGTGSTPDDAFPAQLTELLHNEGFRIQLVENPSQPGATSMDIINYQLPVFRSQHPTFATLLVGANDVNQGVSVDVFRVNFTSLVDDMLNTLPASRPLIIATIPDFTLTPVGRQAARGRDLKDAIAEFNRVIHEEATDRNLQVADFYTQSLDFDRLDIALDGLHPSPRGHRTFASALLGPATELLILPEVD